MKRSTLIGPSCAIISRNVVAERESRRDASDGHDRGPA